MRSLFVLCLALVAGCISRDNGPSASGALRFTITVSAGGTPDTGNFLVAAGRDSAKIAATGGTAVLEELPTGKVVVALLGTAPWCHGTPATQEVHITAGDTTEASAVVHCDTTFGAVRIVMHSGGIDLDLDGYRVSLDDTSLVAGSNDTLVISRQSLRPDTLRVRNIRRTCWLTGDSTQIVIPPLPGDTIDVSMEFQCGVIFFQGFPGGPARVYQINVTSGEVRSIAAFNVLLNSPSSSPDGGTIVFGGNVDTVSQLFRTTPTGASPVQVSDIPEGPVWADWLSGDTLLVYSMHWATPISLASLSSGVVTPIPGSIGPEDGAVVRPGGAELAYQQRDSAFTTSAVWIMNIDGSGRKPAFTTEPDFSFGPSWSPNGELLALAGWSATGDSGRIYVGAPGTAAPIAITSPSYPYDYDSSPRWSGDGLWIAFLRHSFLDAGEHLFLVHPDGTGIRSIELPYAWNGGFTWLK